MIQAIINACNHTLTKNSIHDETKSSRLLILHAGSYDTCIENSAKYYTNCDIQFMNLPDIHAINRSAQMLRRANAVQCDNWLSQVTSTRWLQNLSALITAASCVVANVNKDNRPVLVHCSNGRDHTPQIITLAEIMLDSYYRTINGFQILVEREWIQFGHEFGDRCGHGVDANDPNERSPIFLQWLDCIYQLIMENQTAFQFNEIFLVLYPSCSSRNLRIWSDLYLYDTRYMPTDSYHHPSSLSTYGSDNNNNNNNKLTNSTQSNRSSNFLLRIM
ncbi:unnamed protein product [Rotaria sp. Silwood1]|nr:unnamed protein product [Rotaria sp. Silwood1]CAF5006136.1 unnamed protein product [Rotaria sp. Silwood1]CAF5040219.1 unnamed protein product [Rotaria sp. Silwood1]